MCVLEPRIEKHLDILLKRYPSLEECRKSIIDAYFIMEECYRHDGKMLIAGNGGSAAE